MPKMTAKNLLDANCSDLGSLIDATIALAKDSGYLSGRRGFENTLAEIDTLLAELKNRIIQIASN